MIGAFYNVNFQFLFLDVSAYMSYNNTSYSDLSQITEIQGNEKREVKGFEWLRKD